MNFFVFILVIFVTIFKLSTDPVYSSVDSDEVDFYEESSGDFSWRPYDSSNDLLKPDESFCNPSEKQVVIALKSSNKDENDSLDSNEIPCNYKHPRYQLRTQIKDDLDLLTNISPSVHDQLANSILCLGTGRLVSRLFYSHLCPTLVEADDYCVDLRTSLEPDESFNVFDNESLERFNKKGMTFGFVYFSHVGSYFPHDQMCCYYYSRLVKPGGALLFKSYAFLPAVDLLKEMSFNSMEEAHNFYKKILKLWGFKNIQVIQKSEAVNLSDGEAFGKSLIIYAERAKDKVATASQVNKARTNGEPQDKISSPPQSPDISEEDDLEKTVVIEFEESNDDASYDEDAARKNLEEG